MADRTASYQGVVDAARQIQGAAVRTPLIESPDLNERMGGRILLKAETMQVAGAFKFRGAYNRISRLTDEERGRGVVAFSSGNHAQGVAAAARMVGTAATIVMPADSPAIKVAGVKSFGGEVRLYDRWTESREEIGAQLARDKNAILVPPFDDPFIIEGQGTTALEILDQADGPIDQLVCCCSGGGLMAGINLVLEAQSPATESWAVEPENYDDTARSLKAGERVGHPRGPPSICDALQTPIPGELTFPINQRVLKGALTISDAEAAEAVRYAFRTLKLVVEPGGAAALAAVLAGKIETRGRTTAIVLSGGNIDPGLFAAIIEDRFTGAAA
ncbi:threonine ammonia-lyase [Brevundimonas aurifodinae]|uniref:Threonine/serine dehydratase n=2 Tax=Brevundimonas TaxID=41275 RepID=A0ABV1NJI1_9CAUL|nr:MAG: pyridoxal-5'-phosphate-dependent protein [Brevundimonas sp. 12-68-7]OYX34892.1 MAG: pyridoxal-5'-phosphate-dependent protein [Brevundimonas subvibrioides]